MGTAAHGILHEIRLPEKYVDWSFDDNKER
jgi:hypothetical protein